MLTRVENVCQFEKYPRTIFIFPPLGNTSNMALMVWLCSVLIDAVYEPLISREEKTPLVSNVLVNRNIFTSHCFLKLI